MPRFDKPPVAMVTRENLDWAVEFTGRTKAELELLLKQAEKQDCVCAVEARKGYGQS